MDDFNMIKNFVDQMTTLVKGILYKSDLPVIKSCIIVSSYGNNKFSVRRNGEVFEVRGHRTYAPGEVVEVLLPGNKWERAFIIY